MIFKVITVISLLKVCVADTHTHLQPRSDQAISSHSFERHDVPISYKYSWAHVYTPTPEQPSQPLVRQQPPKIQYAPLYGDGNQQFIPNSINKLEEKIHLEPKLSEQLRKQPKTENENDHHHQPHLSYVPGYNIEVLQTVSKFPGHNAVYRSYPNMASNEKLKKVNYLNQYVLAQNKGKEFFKTTLAPPQNENPTTAVTPVPQPTVASFAKQTYGPPSAQFHGIEGARYHPNVLMVPMTKQALPPNVHMVPGPHSYPQNVKMVPLGSQSLIDVQEYVPHPKAHKMLLNIARTYNIAHVLPKAQHGITLKNPTHTQAFIQIRSPTDTQKNSFLSVQNRHLYSPVVKA